MLKQPLIPEKQTLFAFLTIKKAKTAGFSLFLLEIFTISFLSVYAHHIPVRTLVYASILPGQA